MRRTQLTRNSAPRQSRGLGDSIEKLTQATGIKKVVDTVSKVTGTHFIWAIAYVKR